MRPSNNTQSPQTKENIIRSPSPPDRKQQTPNKPDRINNYIQDPPSSEPSSHYPVFFTPLSRMVYKHRSTCSSRDSAQKEREIHFSETNGQANILAQRKQKLSITRQQYQPRRKEFPQQQWKIDMLKQFEESSKNKVKNDQIVETDKGIFQHGIDKQSKLEVVQSARHKYTSNQSSSSKLAEFCESQNFNAERSIQGVQSGLLNINENQQEEKTPNEQEQFCDLSKNFSLRPQNKQPQIGKQLRKEGTLFKKNKSTNQQETLLSDRTHLKCDEQLGNQGSPNRQPQQLQEQSIPPSPPISFSGITKTTSKSTLNFHKIKQPKQAIFSGASQSQQQSSNSCLSSKTSLSIIDLFGSSDFFPLAKSSFCSQINNNPDTSRTQGSSKLNPGERLKETPSNIQSDCSKHATFSSLEEIKNELFHNVNQNKTYFKFVSARKVDGYSMQQQNQEIKSGRVRQCIVKRANSSRERDSTSQDNTNNNFDVKSITLRKQETMSISSGLDEQEVLKGMQQQQHLDGIIPTPMSTYISYSNSCRHQHYVIDQNPGKHLQTDAAKLATHLEGNKMNKTKVLIFNGDKFINPNSSKDTKINPINNLLCSSILTNNDTNKDCQQDKKQNKNGIGLSNDKIDTGIGNATPLSNSSNCQFLNNYNFSSVKHSPNSNQNNNTWKHGRSSTLQLNRNGNLKKDFFEYSQCQQKLQQKQNQGYLSNRSNEALIKPRANSNYENKNNYYEEQGRNPFSGGDIEKVILGVSGFENPEEEETDPEYGIDSYVHDDRHKI